MFLDPCNYFQSHIGHYASTCSSLYDLTAKGVPFVWSNSYKESFRALKEALITAPCLAYPNCFGKFPFLLQCDASNDCVGTVLLQEGADGKMHPVHFLSHRFGKQAQSWHISEKECFAIVFSVMKLRYYLLGTHFFIETDHKNLANLSWVLNQTSNSRLTRWAIMLSDMSFTVKSKKGTEMVVPDAISRLPAAQAHLREHSRVSAIQVTAQQQHTCKSTPERVRFK